MNGDIEGLRVFRLADQRDQAMIEHAYIVPVDPADETICEACS